MSSVSVLNHFRDADPGKLNHHAVDLNLLI